MKSKKTGTSERSRMRRRVNTFARTIVSLLRDARTSREHSEWQRGWNEALEYAARTLEHRGRGGA